MPGQERRHILGKIRLHGRDGLIDTQILAIDVVVHIDDIEVAVCALGDELLQEAKARVTTAVGDGGGGKGDLASEGLDVGFVDRGGLGGGDVGLAGVVGFIGALYII